MAKISKDLESKITNIIKRGADLKRVQARYEEMSRVYYRLPEPLRQFEYIRPVITTAPYDALRGATRALSNLEEGLDIHPITVVSALKGVDDQSKEAAIKANQWETVLKWQMDRAEKRRRSFPAEVVWSVAVYDEAVAQLIHLPTQFKAASLGKRERAAARFGDWALQIVDPKTVYVTSSPYMVESVLSVNVRTAGEILNFWGEEAAGFLAREIAKDRENAETLYVEFDYVDHDMGRVVWATKGVNILDVKGEIILPPQPWLKDAITGEQVPFLNWIYAAGGTDVDLAPQYQRKPILFPVLMAEMWGTANISGTIMHSQQIASASSVTDVFHGPGAEDVQMDHTSPRRRINLTAFQQYQQIQDAGMDIGLREVYDRLEAAIQRATVADVLVTAQPISGEQAFASYNLQVQQALASLGGVKEVSQDFFKRSFEAMLLITHYTGGQISGYGDGLDKYVIDSEDIDPDTIHLTVELKADVPADRLQRATVAVQLVDKVPYSPKRLLRFMGETDPEGSLEEYKLWRLEMADFEGKLDRIRREVSGEYEQDVIEAAQVMIQEQMGGGVGGGFGEEPGGAPGEVSEQGPLRGLGLNPAQLGLPAAAASPTGETFEGGNGMSRAERRMAGL